MPRPEYLHRPSHEHPIFHSGWREEHKVANELWRYALELESENEALRRLLVKQVKEPPRDP